MIAGAPAKHQPGLGVQADDLTVGRELPAAPRRTRGQVELKTFTADQAHLPSLQRHDDGVRRPTAGAGQCARRHGHCLSSSVVIIRHHTLCRAQAPTPGSRSIRIIVRRPSRPSTAIVSGASIVWLSIATRAG